MTEQKPSWISRWLVPDVLRKHPVPAWRQPLPETGSRLRRIGRLLWRAYRFSQTGRNAAHLPGPVFDALLIVLTVIGGVAWLVV